MQKLNKNIAICLLLLLAEESLRFLHSCQNHQAVHTFCDWYSQQLTAIRFHATEVFLVTVRGPSFPTIQKDSIIRVLRSRLIVRLLNLKRKHGSRWESLLLDSNLQCS